MSKIPLHVEHELQSNREKLPFLTFVLCFRTKLRSASFKNQLCVHPPLSALWCNLESSCSLAAFSEANHTSPLCQVINTDISDASCLNTAVLKYSVLCSYVTSAFSCSAPTWPSKKNHRVQPLVSSSWSTCSLMIEPYRNITFPPTAMLMMGRLLIIILPQTTCYQHWFQLLLAPIYGQLTLFLYCHSCLNILTNQTLQRSLHSAITLSSDRVRTLLLNCWLEPRNIIPFQNISLWPPGHDWINFTIPPIFKAYMTSHPLTYLTSLAPSPPITLYIILSDTHLVIPQSNPKLRWEWLCGRSLTFWNILLFNPFLKLS